MLYYFLAGIYVIICFALMLVILLQQGKGGDIANAFGGGGSQAAFGARAGATVLSRATALFAVLFIVGAMVLGIVGLRGGSSVVGGRNPLQQPSTPVAPPAPAGPVNTQSPATTTPAGAAPAPATTPAPAK